MSLFGLVPARCEGDIADTSKKARAQNTLDILGVAGVSR